MNVPFVDLKAQASELHDEFEAAFWSVIERAAYTLGPELQQFEHAFAAFCGCDHAVGVSSGTDAVKLALLAAGVGSGRRSDRAGQHVHRHRRGRQPHRRDAGVRRLPRGDGAHRPGRARGRRRGTRGPRHGGRAGAPLRPAVRHGPDPGGRRPLRSRGGRGRLSGARRRLQGTAVRQLGRRRRLQLLSRQEPGRAGRRRRGHHAKRRAGRSPASPAQPRPGRQVHARR